MDLWFRRSVVVAKCRLDEMSLPRMSKCLFGEMHLDMLDEISCTHLYAIKEEQRCSLSRDGNMDPRNIGKCPTYKFVHIYFFGS